MAMALATEHEDLNLTSGTQVMGRETWLCRMPSDLHTGLCCDVTRVPVASWKQEGQILTCLTDNDPGRWWRLCDSVFFLPVAQF
ncbi:hypothetical protein LEMLEM_LOCUS4257 [Lemmus lemmus]